MSTSDLHSTPTIRRVLFRDRVSQINKQTKPKSRTRYKMQLLVAPIEKTLPPAKMPTCTSNGSANFVGSSTMSLAARPTGLNGSGGGVGCSSMSGGSGSRTSDDAIVGDSDEATNVSDSEADDDDEMDECGRDMTLVDDDDFGYDPNNEAQMMFLQVVEMLRVEQEVRKR